MTPSPEQSSLVERLRVALSWIEPPFVTAETSADELRSRISFCLADAERALERLSQPSDGVTEEMIEKLAREAYEEGVEDGLELDPTDGIPQWIDSVARVNLLRAMRSAATSSDRSE